MQIEITEREQRLLNCYNKNPGAFLESLEKVLSERKEKENGKEQKSGN